MRFSLREACGALALVVASFTLTCVLAEVVLRALGYGALHDVYSRPEIFWRHDELLGWSLEPNARGRYTGPRPFPIEFDSLVETNSQGLRGPEVGPREAGELRVLVLGDSFAAGFEVEQHETFAALIEAPLRRRLGVPVRVINAAVRGYGTDQSYLWFRERGHTFAADLVVAVLSANDFEDNLTLHRPRRPFGKPAFALRPSGALELTGIPVPRYEICSSWILDGNYEPSRDDGVISRGACVLQTRLADHSALFTVVAASLVRLPGAVTALNNLLFPKPPPTALRAVSFAGFLPLQAPAAPASPAASRSRSELEGELTTALLQALARDVRESAASFLLLTGPSNQDQLDLGALRADQIDIQYVDVVIEDPSLATFRNDSHLNAFGHRLYAGGLVPIVERALRARP